MSAPTRPVGVVTGLGVVAPSGLGEQPLWETALAAASRITPIERFDPSPYAVRVAGQVPDFDASEHLESARVQQMDRWSHLGMAAATQALVSAGLDQVAAEDGALDPYACGVCLASSSGGNIFGQQELQRLWSQERRSVSAYQSIAWFYAATVGQASIRHQFKFQSTVLAAEAAGAIDSLAQATRSIRRGGQVILAGGTECPLSPYALVCHLDSGLLAAADEQTRAYAAYSADARGHLLGEGGAVVVVEEAERAAARGATARAEVAGWAATHDARPWSPLSTGGEPAGPGHEHYARAIEHVLTRAGICAADIAAVLPDAMGVAAFDRAEARAIQAAGVTAPVTSVKPVLGRATQGGSAIDVALAVLMLEHGVIPPFAGPRTADDGFGLDLPSTARPLDGDHVLVLARGRDGFNSALVLSRPTRRASRPARKEAA
ncbi:MAG: beta-ketoacyl synthase N-terminal-like domain-containing protein [Tetrasphaera sp.]